MEQLETVPYTELSYLLSLSTYIKDISLFFTDTKYHKIVINKVFKDNVM